MQRTQQFSAFLCYRKNPVKCCACVVARKIETNCFCRNDPVIRISETTWMIYHKKTEIVNNTEHVVKAIYGETRKSSMSKFYYNRNRQKSSLKTERRSFFFLWIMHLSSASPRGGGDPRADVGTLQIVLFKVLVFPHPWGDFFSSKVPSIWRSQARNWLQNFILVLWTVSKHSDWKLNFNYFFLKYYISCSQSGENFNFPSRPEFPRICLNLSGLMKNEGKHTIMMVHCLF